MTTKVVKISHDEKNYFLDSKNIIDNVESQITLDSWTTDRPFENDNTNELIWQVILDRNKLKYVFDEGAILIYESWMDHGSTNLLRQLKEEFELTAWVLKKSVDNGVVGEGDTEAILDLLMNDNRLLPLSHNPKASEITLRDEIILSLIKSPLFRKLTTELPEEEIPQLSPKEIAQDIVNLADAILEQRNAQS